MSANPNTIEPIMPTDEQIDRAGMPSVGRKKGRSSKIVNWIGLIVLAGLCVYVFSLTAGSKKEAKKPVTVQEIANHMAPLVIPARPAPVAAEAAQVQVAQSGTTPPPVAQQGGAAPAKPHVLTWEERNMRPDQEVNAAASSAAAAANSAVPTPPALPAPPSPTAPVTELASRLMPTVMHGSRAGMLGNRDYIITAGTPLLCVTDTRIISTEPGLATCHLDRDVFSASKRVVLMEKGTRVLCEQTGSVKQGEARMFVVCSRAETPRGAIVNLNSPATDALGSAGLEGWVDNHWMQKIGASLAVAMLQDSVNLLIAEKTSSNGGQTFVLTNTTNSGEKISEEIIKSTIKIPPTITIAQGTVIQFILAGDLDFSDVYQLKTIKE